MYKSEWGKPVERLSFGVKSAFGNKEKTVQCPPLLSTRSMHFLTKLKPASLRNAENSAGNPRLKRE